MYTGEANLLQAWDLETQRASIGKAAMLFPNSVPMPAVPEGNEPRGNDDGEDDDLPLLQLANQAAAEPLPEPDTEAPAEPEPGKCSIDTLQYLITVPDYST